MANSQDQNIRLMSCVYLRKIVAALWFKLPENAQGVTKTLLLQRYIDEPVTVVKKNIANVIGALANLLIPNKQWDELFVFIF